MVKSKKEDYGTLVDPAAAAIDKTAIEDEASVGSVVSASPEQAEGSAMWDYFKAGRINGVPVKEDHRNLMVEDEEMLYAAFRLALRPGVLLVMLSPDNQEDLRRYRELLDKVYDGSARILEETKQFDPGQGGFLVFVKYETMEYELHPRYNYMLEETRDDE